jgi:hypothetical protein
MYVCVHVVQGQRHTRLIMVQDRDSSLGQTSGFRRESKGANGRDSPVAAIGGTYASRVIAIKRGNS